MVKRTKPGPLVDTKTYAVVGINGYRQGGLTKDQAFALAARLREQMRTAGWAGVVRVHYRDGSVVKEEPHDQA